MDKEKVVHAMLEKVQNDTRSACVQSGMDLMEIEQTIIKNQQGLLWTLSNLYDFIVEKDLFKN